ncbi:MAG: aspartate kinase [Chloroflexi bacterium]|nr:aspartate kinase [Chloroflexota bacterium]MBI3341167.1 aspartate kinase [Chloroflexota bacterium]
MAGKSRTLVMKFGGTSVGSADAMAKAAQIVKDARADWPRLVVVTSAVSGVTNLLLDSAAQAAKGNLQTLLEAEKSLFASHEKIINAHVSDVKRRAELKEKIKVFINDFGNLGRAIGVLGEASPRALDAIASLGERMSVYVLTGVIESFGISAQAIESTRLIVTNSHFQNAHPDFDATRECARAKLNPILDKGVIPVTTGFIGATPDGIITTLGRGGSDYSAAILGALLPANEVWIWTDVDGVMTSDPRIVPNARALPEISYSEVSELAYYGAKVLHPKTIRPVVEAGIGLRICNTFNPAHPGTRLIANSKSNGEPVNGQVIKAVTAIRKQKLVTIEGRGMLGVPGVAARAFGAVAATGTSVPFITQASSEQSICFAVPSESANDVITSLEKVFSHELEDDDIDRVWATEDVTIVTVVGAGMRHTPGVAGRIFSQLGDRKVNVLAIAQGSSEVSISLVVDASAADTAVKAVHDLIVN